MVTQISDRRPAGERGGPVAKYSRESKLKTAISANPICSAEGRNPRYNGWGGSGAEPQFGASRFLGDIVNGMFRKDRDCATGIETPLPNTTARPAAQPPSH